MFEVSGAVPHGTMLFGVHVEDPAEPAPTHEGFPNVYIGLKQRAMRERDAVQCTVACTSFDLRPPKVWSPETHASFSQESRALVRLLLLVSRRPRIPAAHSFPRSCSC